MVPYVFDLECKIISAVHTASTFTSVFGDRSHGWVGVRRMRSIETVTLTCSFSRDCSSSSLFQCSAFVLPVKQVSVEMRELLQKSQSLDAVNLGSHLHGIVAQCLKLRCDGLGFARHLLWHSILLNYSTLKVEHLVTANTRVSTAVNSEELEF